MKFIATLFIVLLSLSVEAVAKKELTIGSGCSPFKSYDDFIETIGKKNTFLPNFLLEKRFPKSRYDLATKELQCNVVNYQVDGLTVAGVQITPKNMGMEKLPVVVYNRGGNGSFGSIIFASIMDNLAPIADKGFIVVASQYRGHLRKQPELYGQDEFGGSDVNDVHVLIDLIKQHPNADSNNIFMYGVSRGGMMSYMVAKERTDIRAMAIHAGNVDLIADLEFRPEMERVYQALIPSYEANKMAELKKRSAIYWAEALPEKMPILLVHGEKDERVSVDNAKKMANKLNQHNRPFTLSIYPQEGHIFKHKKESQDELVNWFTKHKR